MAATRVTTATTTTTATRPPGFRRTHVRLLTELLLAALQDGDGDTALDILRVLARLQARLPELIWKAGAELLRQHGHPARTVARFYQQMAILTVSQREEILLELAFFHLSVGQEEAAYDTLAARVHTHPFSENPQYHGYAGVIAFQLWQREAEPDRQQRRAQGLLRQSAEHLAQALRLSEESAQFVSVYVEVLAASGRQADAWTLLSHLTQTVHRNHPGLLRLTLEKAQAWRMGRAADLVPLALHFLRLAPHAPPAVALDPLLASLDEQLKTAATEDAYVAVLGIIIDALVLVLDAQPALDDRWTQLAEALTLVRQVVPQPPLLDDCRRRLAWWRRYHFRGCTEDSDAGRAVLASYSEGKRECFVALFGTKLRQR